MPIPPERTVGETPAPRGTCNPRKRFFQGAMQNYATLRLPSTILGAGAWLPPFDRARSTGPISPAYPNRLCWRSIARGVFQAALSSVLRGVHCPVGGREPLKSKVFVSARAWALCLLLTLLALLVSPPLPARGQQKRRSRPDQPRTTKKPSGLNLQKINDPNTREPVGPHSQGEAVVRAAILLSRLKFSPGEMSKDYTNNLAKAISAFQSASGLSTTGTIDAATWNDLNDDQSKLQVEQKQGQSGQNQSNLPQGAQQRNPGNNPSPPQAINSYIIAMEDVAGPFTRIPRVTGRGAAERLMLREAKLKRLNYESPMQLLAEKFHSSPRLLVALNPGKRFDKAGVKLEVP